MEWKFKEGAHPTGNSDDFWYGLTNGYVEPESVLEDKVQLAALNKAIEIVASFEKALCDADLLNEF